MKNDLINAMAADAKATKAKTKSTTSKSKSAKQIEKDVDKLYEQKLAEQQAQLAKEGFTPMVAQKDIQDLADKESKFTCVHMYLRLGQKKIIYRSFTSRQEARDWFKLHVASYRNMLNAYDKDNFQYVITADVILKPFEKGAKK